MRTAYHEQLDALNNQLAEMCRMAGVAMERATQALLQADLILAEQVIGDHDKLVSASARAEETAFVLLGLQAAGAEDLRTIVSSIQIVADVERMGALALHVARISRRRHPQHTLPEEVNGYFAEIGRVAVDLGNSACEVLLSRDPEQARRLHQEKGAEPLAAAQDCVTHGRSEIARGRRRSRLVRIGTAAKQGLEPRLDKPAHAFELFLECHAGD